MFLVNVSSRTQFKFQEPRIWDCCWQNINLYKAKRDFKIPCSWRSSWCCFLWYLFFCRNVANLTNFEIKVGNKPTSVSVSVSSPFLIVLHSVTAFRKLYEGVLTQRKLHPNKLCLIYNDIFCYGGVLRAVGAIMFSHIFNVVDILLIKTNSNV